MRPLKANELRSDCGFSEQRVLKKGVVREGVGGGGLTKRWEAVGLACLGEGRVHSGLDQRRKAHLTGVRRHRWTETETQTFTSKDMFYKITIMYFQTCLDSLKNPVKHCLTLDGQFQKRQNQKGHLLFLL